jgi:hypothetical protein
VSDLSKILLCRDCRFFHDIKCHHKSAHEFSVVSGETKIQYASVMRLDQPALCGPSAKHFDARLPVKRWPWSRA